jgi:hypothetical protein
MSRKQGLPERGRGFGVARSRGPLAGCDRGAEHWVRRMFCRSLRAPTGSNPHKWGPSSAVRRAPFVYGDLTAKADRSGRQIHASVLGRIPIKSEVAATPSHRPPHFFMGMRPAAIAPSCRIDNDSMGSCSNEAAR